MRKQQKSIKPKHSQDIWHGNEDHIQVWIGIDNNKPTNPPGWQVQRLALSNCKIQHVEQANCQNSGSWCLDLQTVLYITPIGHPQLGGWIILAAKLNCRAKKKASARVANNISAIRPTGMVGTRAAGASNKQSNFRRKNVRLRLGTC